jgi:serine/threonine-protein kinase
MTIFQPGTCVGRHRILRLIGSGRVADVYEVIAPDHRRRALKIIKEGLDKPAKKLARFGQEGEAFASIDHLNVVRFFDADIAEGRMWILLELVEGPDLRRLVDAAGGALPVERAVRIVRGACEGVDAAHQLGILHRDLCPENILVAADDVAKVADFGSAKPETYGVKTTNEKDVLSSLYMAPEFMTSRVAEARSDVYSMGLLLYEIIAGAHPISSRSANVMEIVRRQLDYVPPPLASLGRDVPGDLSYLVENALAKDPVRRCTMRELADGLGVILQRLNVQRRQAVRSLPLPDRGPKLAQTELAMPAFPSGGTMPMAAFPEAPPAPPTGSGPVASRPVEAAPVAAPVEAVPSAATSRPEPSRDAVPPPAPSRLPPTLRSAWQPPPAPAPAPPLPPSANEGALSAERGSTSIPVERSAPPPVVAPKRRTPLLAALLATLAVGLAAGGWLLFGRAPVAPLAAPASPPPASSAPAPPAVASSSAAKRPAPPPAETAVPASKAPLPPRPGATPAHPRRPSP